MKTIDGLPPKIYEAVWNTDFFDGPNTRRNEWNRIVAALALLEDVDRRYPGSASVAHKRVNRLVDALRLVREHPRLAEKTGPLSSVVRLGAACIAAMPARVKFDTPYGSACTDAWIEGHTAFATHAPERIRSWKQALAGFQRAAQAAIQAPRTPMHAHLKTTKHHHALLAAGRTAPWFAAAVALSSER
jgi:hypothetical protein